MEQKGLNRTEQSRQDAEFGKNEDFDVVLAPTIEQSRFKDRYLEKASLFGYFKINSKNKSATIIES